MCQDNEQKAYPHITVLLHLRLPVHVSLRRSVGEHLRNHMSNLHQFFVHATYDRGSVLFWRCCDILCTSGFMNDAVFAHIMAKNGRCERAYRPTQSELTEVSIDLTPLCIAELTHQRQHQTGGAVSYIRLHCFRLHMSRSVQPFP